MISAENSKHLIFVTQHDSWPEILQSDRQPLEKRPVNHETQQIQIQRTMEFATRLCSCGDEKSLSLGQPAGIRHSLYNRQKRKPQLVGAGLRAG